MALGVQRIASRRGIVAGAVIIAAGASALPASAAVFNGNGASGFGGTLGNGSLTVTDQPDGTINFSFTPSGSFNSNGIALYIDSVPGGFTSTSSFTDHADGGRTILSGTASGSQTVANFAPGFAADYGISLEPTFANLFQLNSGSFTSLGSANLSGSGSGPFTFSINASQIGLTPNAGRTVGFEASLISTTAYRSNETIGTSTTVPDTGAAPNAGFNGSVTFSSFASYTLVPEPASLGLLGAGAMLLVGRRRR